MKKVLCIFAATIVLSACTAEVGSDDWCKGMGEKNKGDWTANEATDYGKHCLL